MAAPVSASQRTVESVMNPAIGVQGDVREYMMDFCDPAVFAKLAKVSKAWQEEVKRYSETPKRWKTALGMIPEVVPAGMSHNKLLADLLPRSIGPQFYEKYLGGVNPPPRISPRCIEEMYQPDRFGECDDEGRLAQMKKANCQLVYHPQSIKVRVGPHLPLTLNERGLLVKDLATPVVPREICVPASLNNATVLMEQCLKQGNPTGIHRESWQNILDQHGDKTDPDHLTYHRIRCVDKGRTFAEQQADVVQAGYEVTSLRDRVYWNLLTRLSSKVCLGDTCEVRTSTLTLDDRTPPLNWPSIVWWARVPPLRLCLLRDIPNDKVGVAVSVPAGSSQVIGS
ncbi:MAG TPA: hypothetical protein VLF94_06180 [Chlamydiales bacterium]|nr:hypothetical protein [Chlamydiales bacterium]